MESLERNPTQRMVCNLRDEESGIKSYFPLNDCANRQIHFMNQTAAQIYELCDGNNNCENIARILGKRYLGVEHGTLLQDVKECLHTLKNHEFIEWEEEPNLADDLIRTRVAEERDFKKISAFVIQCLDANENCFSHFPVKSKPYYNAFYIRTRQFHGKEIFLVVEKEGSVEGVASFVPSGHPLKSAQLGSFAVSGTPQGEMAEALLHGILATLKRLGLVKLKCDLISKEDRSVFGDFLLAKGFHVEATLAGETENNEDIFIYSLFF